MSVTSTVLFVNRVAPPSSGATGWMLHDLVGELRTRGVDADTLTLGDVGTSIGTGRRALRGLADLRMLGRQALAARAETVVLMTDPPLLPLATAKLQRRGRRVVHWVMDLYPDVAAALGVLPSPAAAPLGLALRRARRQADAVVAIGEDMAARLASQGVEDPLVVPNWAPPSVGPASDGAAAFRWRYGLDGFVLMYSGNLGRAHPTAALFEAAWQLRRDGITVLVVGGGDEGKAKAAAGGARWLPSVSRASLGASLGAADAHVVLQDKRTMGMLVPSKVYGAAATGRPVAFLGPRGADAGTIAASSPRGIVLDPGDADGLVEWARSLAADPPAPRVPPLPTAEAAAEAFRTLLR